MLTAWSSWTECLDFKQTRGRSCNGGVCDSGTKYTEEKSCGKYFH